MTQRTVQTKILQQGETITTIHKDMVPVVAINGGSPVRDAATVINWLRGCACPAVQLCIDGASADVDWPMIKELITMLQLPGEKFKFTDDSGCKRYVNRVVMVTRETQSKA